MRVRICARCRKPWTSESGWCSCGAYDTDTIAEVVPLATYREAVERIAELKAELRDWRAHDQGAPTPKDYAEMDRLDDHGGR